MSQNDLALSQSALEDGVIETVDGATDAMEDGANDAKASFSARRSMRRGASDLRRPILIGNPSQDLGAKNGFVP